MKGLIGKKVGMTQIYDENGVLIPVTVIEAGPCTVLQVKTKECDGYSALQVGFGSAKVKNTSKSVLGNVAKAGLQENPPAFIREFRADADPTEEVGSQLKVDIFAEGEYLDISGITSVADATDTAADGTGNPVQSDAVKNPVISSRARKWPVIWATPRSRFRICAL